MKRFVMMVSAILAVMFLFSCANAEWWQEKKTDTTETKQQEYYESLYYGDRGARVRALKLRLYEL